jgi:hypothetical protein
MKWLAGMMVWLAVVQTGWCFYNPSTGRWLNRDPIKEPGFSQLARPSFRKNKTPDGNPYRFLHNDAIAETDYLGLWYNIFTHCCCKGKLVPRASRGTGVYMCNIPFAHSWVFVADQPGGTTGTGYGWYSKEYDEKTNQGESCGSADDAVSVGKVVNDPYNPDYCKEIKLRPCSFDIDKFRQEVVNYFKNLQGQTYIFMVFDCRQAANGAIDKATVKSIGCTSK